MRLDELIDRRSCSGLSALVEPEVRHHPRIIGDTSRYGVKIVMSGPLVSDDGQTMIGSLFLIEAPSRAEVEAFNGADPFAAASIWEKVSITGFSRRQG
ncbi:YciI family protein [Bradyrhizobium sp. AUGA SZCCT0160]|nr:YciI family protein [Bradyrhizobium sp. AUGA SZCCT0160]